MGLFIDVSGMRDISNWRLSGLAMLDPGTISNAVVVRDVFFPRWLGGRRIRHVEKRGTLRIEQLRGHLVLLHPGFPNGRAVFPISQVNRTLGSFCANCRMYIPQ